MSYKITYGPTKRTKLRNRKWTATLIALVLVAFVALYVFIYPVQIQRIADTLFPWPDEAVAAFSEELEYRKDLGAAFHSFCEVIISDIEVLDE